MRVSIGQRVFVIDSEHKDYLRAGQVIAIYDSRYFNSGVCVLMNGHKRRLKPEQIEVIDGSLPYSSRGDLYRAIKAEKIKGQEIVDVLRELRDRGAIKILLPANLK